MRLFIRVLRWLLAGVAVMILGLALSIPLDWFLNRGKVADLTNQVISSAGQDIRVFMASPETDEKLPAIIMIHEFWGLKESLIGKAQALSEEGYVVVAPDTFRGQTASWVPTAIVQVLTHQTEQINSDLDAVYDWLERQEKVDPARIMVMGFCYGGGASLEYSLHNPRLKATGIFYGSLITDSEKLKSLPGPVLGIFGGKDGSIPVEEVNAFEAALGQSGIEHQISIYEDQGHAFVESMEGIRAGGVQARAWQEFLAFSAQHLKETF